MTRLLVTGAGGFVGRHLVPKLVAAGHDVTTAGRSPSPGSGLTHVTVGEVGPHTDWSRALDGCETVVHLAAQVPLRGTANSTYASVNDQGTERLARQAQGAGVGRLVALSSIFAASQGEVHGTVPQTPYGASKRAAEAHIRSFAGSGRTGISLRSPLVYGAGSTGNWPMLQKLAALPVLLPFGAVRNRRSMIAVENLVDAILATIAKPHAASGTYSVADDGTVSLAEIVTWLRAGNGREPGLLSLPPGMIRHALSAIGQGQAAQSLLGDLFADTASFKAMFRWAPPFTSRAAIMAAGRASGQSRRTAQ